MGKSEPWTQRETVRDERADLEERTDILERAVPP